MTTIEIVPEINPGETLSPQQQQELESLVEAELEATIERAARMGATNSAPSIVASLIS